MTKAQLEFKRRCEKGSQERREKLEADALEFFEQMPTADTSPEKVFLLGYWLGRQRSEEEFQRLDRGFVEEDFT